jgi:putative endonuclease
VTNNLSRRTSPHKQKFILGFTAKYNVTKLVYYEVFPTPGEAIAAEKKIKGWTRKKKIALIQSMNPNFHELDPSADASG